jgi:archaellum biogenesis ATPase FlaH
MAMEEPEWNDLHRPYLLQSNKVGNPYWESSIIFNTPKHFKENGKILNNIKQSTEKYTAHVTCVQKMFDNGPVIGQRHQTVLRMVSSWKRNGINIVGANALLNAWDNEFAQDEEAQKILDTIYNWEHNGYGCNDPIMDKYCDSICKFYKSKDYGIEVFNADSMSNDFQEFVQVNFENKTLDLNDMFDIGASYKFTVGELITMIGDTKLGKTAFIQNLVARADKFKCLYLSLEVNQKLMWRRFCQIAFNKTKQEVTKHYIDNDQEFIAQAKEKLGHIKILTVSPEINNVLDVISNLQPTVIVIDTLDEIRVDYINDGLMKMQKIVSKLKEIAQQYEVMIFAVSHISKTAAYDGNLNRHSAKGDSSIEQKSDKLLGISAPNPQSKARVIESIVARDESGFKLRCWFNHETFRFQQTSE